MCISYSFSITIIRDSPFSLSLSLFTWSQSLGRKNPNYFRFIRESILGNLSVTVFHSGHPSHLLKLPINRIAVRKPSPPATFPATFSGDFRRSPFPTPTMPSGAQGGDLQVLSKHRREILSHTPATRVFSPTV